MIKFKSFIKESFLLEAEGGSSSNEHFGVAYETAVALHLHNNTGSRTNMDPEHQKRMQEINKKGKEAFDKLPDNLKQRALESAKASADAYLKSLKDNHGIDAKDIVEVHHTSKGIDNLIHAKADRIQNPHDVVVKTKSGQLHGASLKATQGTLSNNGIGTVDSTSNNHGVELHLGKIWEKGKKKAGLEGKSGAEIKAVRDQPKVKEANKATQAEAASHHAQEFNKASTENQREHLRYLMKSGKPAVPYDYVNGEKGKAIPSDQLEHAQAINNSKKLEMRNEKGSNLVKVYGDGKHLATIEHRPTHGAFNGIQVNTKIGSMKAE